MTNCKILKIAGQDGSKKLSSNKKHAHSASDFILIFFKVFTES